MLCIAWCGHGGVTNRNGCCTLIAYHHTPALLLQHKQRDGVYGTENNLQRCATTLDIIDQPNTATNAHSAQ